MKVLYLLRHAKAEPGGKAADDADRPLSARGREACEVIGAYLREKKYAPALVLSSPSARTKETWDRVEEACGLHTPCELHKSLYLATAEEIVGTVQHADGRAPSLMVIGHNPGMHHAALAFSRPQATPQRKALELKFPTGALAVLHFRCERWDEVFPGEGTLTDFATPAPPAT